MSSAAETVQVNLTVTGDGAKAGPEHETIDIIDRDPTRMNQHLKVAFEEIFAEPHNTVYSFDTVWTISFTVFRNTKLWCYRILTLLCAVPAGFIWGINFACLSCCTIWCCRPCIRYYEISLACAKDFFTIVVMTFYRPCYEAMGFCFYNIRVTLLKGRKTEA